MTFIIEEQGSIETGNYIFRGRRVDTPQNIQNDIGWVRAAESLRRLREATEVPMRRFREATEVAMPDLLRLRQQADDVRAIVERLKGNIK